MALSGLGIALMTWEGGLAFTPTCSVLCHEEGLPQVTGSQMSTFGHKRTGEDRANRLIEIQHLEWKTISIYTIYLLGSQDICFLEIKII